MVLVASRWSFLLDICLLDLTRESAGLALWGQPGRYLSQSQGDFRT